MTTIIKKNTLYIPDQYSNLGTTEIKVLLCEHPISKAVFAYKGIGDDEWIVRNCTPLSFEETVLYFKEVNKDQWAE